MKAHAVRRNSSSAAALELFERHQKWAEGIARSCLRHLPPSFDGDDLKQAALLALWQAASKFDTEYGVPFLAYAHPYVQNACWMQVRRREFTERTMDPLSDTIQAPAERRPDEQVMREQVLADTCEQVEKLPAAHRKVMQALFWQSATLNRLAVELHTTAGKVAAMRDEALELIREESKRKQRFAEMRRGVERLK